METIDVNGHAATGRHVHVCSCEHHCHETPLSAVRAMTVRKSITSQSRLEREAKQSGALDGETVGEVTSRAGSCWTRWASSCGGNSRPRSKHSVANVACLSLNCGKNVNPWENITRKYLQASVLCYLFSKNVAETTPSEHMGGGGMGGGVDKSRRDNVAAMGMLKKKLLGFHKMSCKF